MRYRTSYWIGAALLLVAAVAVVAVSRYIRAEVQRDLAEQRRDELKKALGIENDPVAYLGDLLREAVTSGQHPRGDDVEKLLRGYEEKSKIGEYTYYFFFIRQSLIRGRCGAYVAVKYSEDGVVTDVGWDSAGLLPR